MEVRLSIEVRVVPLTSTPHYPHPTLLQGDLQQGQSTIINHLCERAPSVWPGEGLASQRSHTPYALDFGPRWLPTLPGGRAPAARVVKA